MCTLLHRTGQTQSQEREPRRQSILPLILRSRECWINCLWRRWRGLSVRSGRYACGLCRRARKNARSRGRRSTDATTSTPPRMEPGPNRDEAGRGDGRETVARQGSICAKKWRATRFFDVFHLENSEKLHATWLFESGVQLKVACNFLTLASIATAAPVHQTLVPNARKTNFIEGRGGVPRGVQDTFAKKPMNHRLF
jgi:hypothetical protein